MLAMLIKLSQCSPVAVAANHTGEWSGGAFVILCCRLAYPYIAAVRNDNVTL